MNNLVYLSRLLQYGGEVDGEEGGEGGECITPCEEKPSTLNPFKYVFYFFKCFIPIKPKTYKEINLPCSLQKIINILFKVMVGIFGIIIIPLWPWILIAIYSWRNFNKFIISAFVGQPLPISKLIIYILIIVVTIVAMLFIID